MRGRCSTPARSTGRPLAPPFSAACSKASWTHKARRNLGAHYTSEENILKLIKPLFLDALWAEFEKVKSNKNRLFEFHEKLRTLTFFDPACGCGNFLVISYRELRLLEIEVLRASYREAGQQTLDVHQLISLNVDQFFGIEIEEFPAQIAQVALWLVDHQMNLRVSEELACTSRASRSKAARMCGLHWQRAANPLERGAAGRALQLCAGQSAVRQASSTKIRSKRLM